MNGHKYEMSKVWISKYNSDAHTSEEVDKFIINGKSG